MSDLRFDGDSLRAAATRVRHVVESFASAGSDAHDAAEYVGHAGLAGRVREFADGWDIHRAKFTEELHKMADLLEAVDDTFTDLDNATAQKLRQATATMASALAPSGPQRTQGMAPSRSGGHDA